ncbi:MAG: UDP-N-acetylmuramate dehydrogenase [Parachlamydiales bacterium]|jgi:UDP-N-acetylmuramate dehydrogenase
MGLQLQRNKELKRLTTFGIGGKAAFFAEVKNPSELKEAFLIAQKNHWPWRILGAGSNLLFDEKGFDGLVIQSRISFCFKKRQLQSGQDGLLVQVGSGYRLSQLALKTSQEGFGGLEFAFGLPASLGGAVYMNAGAFGSNLGQVVQKIDFLFFNGAEKQFLKADLDFGYRFSSLQKLSGFIVGAELFLPKAEKTEERALAFWQKRQKTQPWKEKSAGSIFRNPPGFFAAALIESCGLKGVRIGGAQISSLHANFIVNLGAASSRDVLDLIALMKSQVKARHQVELQEEIAYVPYRN